MLAWLDRDGFARIHSNPSGSARLECLRCDPAELSNSAKRCMDDDRRSCSGVVGNFCWRLRMLRGRAIHVSYLLGHGCGDLLQLLSEPTAMA